VVAQDTATITESIQDCQASRWLVYGSIPSTPPEGDFCASSRISIEHPATTRVCNKKDESSVKNLQRKCRSPACYAARPGDVFFCVSACSPCSACALLRSHRRRRKKKKEEEECSHMFQLALSLLILCILTHSSTPPLSTLSLPPCHSDHCYT
jgi:hypothetical protein